MFANMKKQTSFQGLNEFNSGIKTHGGSASHGKRKVRRPLDRNRPIHLVLKATNSQTLLWKQKEIKEIIKRISAKFGIKIHSLAIQYDHVHLNFSFQHRGVYVMWVRALTGILAQKIAGLKFESIPFTRVIASWGKDYHSVQAYIERNQIEADFLFRIHRELERARLQLLKELGEVGFNNPMSL